MRIIATLLILAAVGAAQETDAKPAYLGVSVADVGPETRGQYKIDEAVTHGAVLLTVSQGSPAARAGWRVGDVVVLCEGKAVRGVDDLIAAVRMRRAGDRIAYRLHRAGGVIAGKLTLGARPVATDEPERPAVVKPAVKPTGGTLEQRLERIQKEIEALRRRVAAERDTDEKRPAPRSLGGWIEREQRAARAALAKGDEQRARWHTIRLSILREMRAAGARMPRGQLDRMDKKLDEILQFLRHNK